MVRSTGNMSSMNKNNNSTSKMVDEKISCDSSIKGKLLRTFNIQ